MAEDASAERKKGMNNRKKRNGGKNREFSESGKDIREEVLRGLREEIKEIIREQKEEITQMNRMLRERIKAEKNEIIRIVSGGEQMIAGQGTDASVEKKKGTRRTTGTNGMEEKSGSLMKVETRLKERRNNYENVEMLKRKRDVKG